MLRWVRNPEEKGIITLSDMLQGEQKTMKFLFHTLQKRFSSSRKQRNLWQS